MQNLIEKKIRKNSTRFQLVGYYIQNLLFLQICRPLLPKDFKFPEYFLSSLTSIRVKEQIRI